MILVMTLLPLHMFVNVCSHLHWLRKICQLCRREARVMMSWPKSSPPKSISHWLFQFRYSNSTDIVASSSSFPRPATTLPRRACSWAKAITAHCKTRQTRFLYPYQNTVLIYFYNINAGFHCYTIKNNNKNCADCLRNLPELLHCLGLFFLWLLLLFCGCMGFLFSDFCFASSFLSFVARWLPHRLSKRQSLSTTTVLFTTTFSWMIKLNLLMNIYLKQLTLRCLSVTPRLAFTTLQ